MDPFEDKVAAIVRDAVEVIQTYRRLRKLSCEDLANAAIIARQSPYNLEGGATKRPSMGMMSRLWLVLEIPPEALAEIVRRHSRKHPEH